MAGLADWLEDYRNWRGRQEWEQGKGWQDFFGGDPRAQEQFEKLSGFGTDAGGLVGMIKASHGSPHAFTKFDFSKIGTGEGAQAYGYGGYFAQGFDSPVAKEYRDALAGVEVGGKVMTPEWDSPYYYPLQALRKHGDDIEKARADVYERNKNIPGGWPEELVAFEDAVKQGIKRNQGHLYNVELRWPDAAREAADPLGEHHLLDWDAPLSEQPGIAAKLGFSTKTKDQIHDEYDALVAKHGYYHEMPPEIQAKVEQLQNELNNQVPNLTGEQFYSGNTENDYLHSVLSGKKFSKEQSDYLRELGIPGIRYLDQASRGVGEGTRNYVMFDDALANIVSRNGVSLSDLVRKDLPYQIEHKPMTIEGGAAPLHDLLQAFGDEIYGNPRMAEQLWGSGFKGEKEMIGLMQKLRGKPEELVDIYRGVPEGVTDINPGDWVTLHPRYAEEYGNVISKKVPAKYITSWPDSLVEFGYYPK